MSAFLEKTRAVREQFVRPVYLSLLHANFARRLNALGNTETGVAVVRTQISNSAATISDEQIGDLLSEPEWRGRLAAGWYVGLSGRIAFVDQIASLLLASQQPYAGQGYCIALALIGNEESRRHLRTYLSHYLPIQGRFYDQEWAIGALTYIEGTRPQEYLRPELWAEAQNRMNPTDAIVWFSELMDYLERHQMRTVP